MQSIVQLREKRAAVYEQMKGVADSASSSAWNRLDAEVDALSRQIEEAERAQHREEAAASLSGAEYASEAEFTEFIQTRGSSP